MTTAWGNSRRRCWRRAMPNLAVVRPADANAVLRPKLEELKESGAETLITANPGCQLQWQSGVQSSGLDVRVMHLAEALAGSLDKFKGSPSDVQ